MTTDTELGTLLTMRPLVQRRDPRAWPLVDALLDLQTARLTRAAVKTLHDELPEVDELLADEGGLAELFGTPEPRWRPSPSRQTDARPKGRDRFAKCATVEARL